MAKRLTSGATSARPPAARAVLTKKDIDEMRMRATGMRTLDEAMRRRLRSARIVLEPGELAALLEALLNAAGEMQVDHDTIASADREIAALKEELSALRARLAAFGPLRSRQWTGQVSGQIASPPLPAPGLAKRNSVGKKKNAA